MKYLKLSTSFVFILITFYCTPRIKHTNDSSVLEHKVSQDTIEEVNDHHKDMFANVLPDSISAYIRTLVDSIAQSEIYTLDNEFIFSNYVLPAIYQRGHFGFNWENSQNRDDALFCLESSWTDGLEPSDYHLKKIHELRDHISRVSIPDYELLASYDVLITDALLLYASHLVNGKLDPRTLDVNWNYLQKELPDDAVKQFESAIERGNLIDAVYGLRPQHTIYSRFVEERIRFQQFKDRGGWGQVSFAATVKPGETVDGLEALRKRLAVTGELADSVALTDSVYIGEIVEAVKRFQTSHGLESDGVIGRNTRDALNMSVDQSITTINVNMERVRWVLDDFVPNMLLINIAGYKLYLFQDSVRQFATKVMVGTAFNQTPVFRSKLQYLVFNPSWTVPYSIATKEILPQLKEDSTYLSSKNMVLLNSQGDLVDPTVIDWSVVTGTTFRYTVRQESGRSNALGQVKFMFPNNFSVYLHDTPSRYLFAREQRAFSHGCIRVQNPLVLAEKLLEDKNWDSVKIKEVLDEEKEKVIQLSKPVDVFLLYWTSGFLDNGDLFFYKDIYSRDPRIDEGLRNNNWKQIIATRPRFRNRTMDYFTQDSPD